MSVSETAYIDANVIIYHIFPLEASGAAHKKTVRLIMDVEEGKLKLAISTFTIGEIKATSKRLLAKALNRIPNEDELKKIADEVERTLSDWGVDIYDAERLITPARTLIITEAERIIDFSIPIKTTDDKWHMIGFADALAALFASKIPTKYFATFDVAFRGLKWSVTPMVLW